MSGASASNQVTARRPPPTAESAFRRRRLAGLIIVLGLLIALVNIGQWVQHERLRRHIDVELGARLLGVAGAAALQVDGEMLRRWSDWGVDADEEDRLLAALREILTSSAVVNIFLVDPDGRSIVDLARVVGRGEANPVIALDRASFTLAAAGIPGASPLRDLDGDYLKAAYVPVEADDGEVVAVLGVEGASGLFMVLADLRRTMLAVGIGSVLGIVLLGLVLVRISSSLARAERELQRAETLTAMGRMAAGIAHEVRNPLGIIRASAERLGRRQDAARGTLAESIVEEVDRLNGIVTGYLEFASERPGDHQPLDLVTLVRRTLRLLADELRGIEVTETIAVPAAMVRGDAARLKQAILNLVLNARQAMPAGGGLHIALDGRAEDGKRFCVLRISDTGTGISAADLKEVWKPFYTSKPEGSGLGLTIVRRIVDEHGGGIRLDSEPGRGTTVTVLLPELAR